MIVNYSPLTQALLGTLFTWGVTAAGSAMVFVFRGGQRKVLDGSLGFAAGVMTAATFWSLLEPAIEMAGSSGAYGKDGEWAFVPAVVGFVFGALFVYLADKVLPYFGVQSHSPCVAMALEAGQKMDKEPPVDLTFAASGLHPSDSAEAAARRRNVASGEETDVDMYSQEIESADGRSHSAVQWKRILLLIVAITVHNIPEGLAVGVGFGAIGKASSATFAKARSLAFGIGIQNFPEGLAVSLPLRGSGMSAMKSFWYGQLSGMVEPIAGVLGAFAVVTAEPLLPYALAFAGGAMIYVVVDDIIPEAQTSGNGRIASWMAIVGFAVMMCLDVGLG